MAKYNVTMYDNDLSKGMGDEVIALFLFKGWILGIESIIFLKKRIERLFDSIYPKSNARGNDFFVEIYFEPVDCDSEPNWRFIVGDIGVCVAYLNGIFAESKEVIEDIVIDVFDDSCCRVEYIGNR